MSVQIAKLSSKMAFSLFYILSIQNNQQQQIHDVILVLLKVIILSAVPQPLSMPKIT